MVFHKSGSGTVFFYFMEESGWLPTSDIYFLDWGQQYFTVGGGVGGGLPEWPSSVGDRQALRLSHHWAFVPTTPLSCSTKKQKPCFCQRQLCCPAVTGRRQSSPSTGPPGSCLQLDTGRAPVGWIQRLRGPQVADFCPKCKSGQDGRADAVEGAFVKRMSIQHWHNYTQMCICPLHKGSRGRSRTNFPMALC